MKISILISVFACLLLVSHRPAFAAESAGSATATPPAASTVSSAAEPLKFFVPGEYSLDESSEEHSNDCGDGDFCFRDDGSNVKLGYMHGFEIGTVPQQVESGAPDEEGCIYRLDKKSVDVKSDETVLTFVDSLVCKGKVRRTLSEITHVRPEKIVLESNQTGEDAYNYTCTWTMKSKAKTSACAPEPDDNGAGGSSSSSSSGNP